MEKKQYNDSSLIHLEYTYKYPFTTIVQAFLNQIQFQSASTLQSYFNVEQVSPDMIIIHKRIENSVASEIKYERIMINRFERAINQIKFDKTPTLSQGFSEQSIIQEKGENETSHDYFYKKALGGKNIRYDLFKIHVANIIKTIKFTEFSKESKDGGQ